MPAQGIEKIPLRIPANWDPVWFSRFIREVLALADIRNSFEGPGISITGTSDVPATVSASADILNLLQQAYVLAAPSSFLPNERVLSPQSGVTTVTDGGPDTTITVGVALNGIGNPQIRQSQPLSVIGRIFNSVGDVADITAYADGDVLRVLPNSGGDLILGFGDIVLRPPNFANPSALVGLAAINGSAITAMRSDAAPAINQAITPTWTGQHEFSLTPTVGSVPVVLQSRTLTAGAGLTGGGDLSANRTFDVGAGTGITVNTNDVALDAATQALLAGSALTKTDDTNVTLTLGGSATTALLRAASVTVGWTGTLAKTRGGFGLDSTTLTGYVKAAGSGAITASATIPYSDITGGPSAVTGANPTAQVGLTAVNGSAGTFLRSDGAPALNQGIAPTWTGTHVFSAGSSAYSVIISNATGSFWRFTTTSAAADAKHWQNYTASDGTFNITSVNDSFSVGRSALTISRSGVAISDVLYGNSTDNPPHTFYGSIIGNVQHNGAAATGAASSGTYTPTAVAVTNVASVTGNPSRWIRTGNVVHVSGSFDVTPTGIGACTVGIPLPIASAFSTATQANGVGAPNGANLSAAYCISDATNDRLTFGFLATGLTPLTVTYSCSYLVV